jgi:Cysteine-rich CWC
MTATLFRPVTSGCPRCGAGFHCGVHDAAPCACTTLSLDADLLARLRERFDGCLCLACLAELQAAHAHEKSRPGLATGRPLREGSEDQS